MGDCKEPFAVFIGYDGREAVASDVCKRSILKRTKSKTSIKYLKHRDLRNAGLFSRTWVTVGSTGDWIDAVDGKPFSTEFSHTRFLVPHLMKYKGWALFMDSDMLFMSDIKRLFELCDDKYAAMCVKHHHKPPLGAIKMDGREQINYYRKNWSSFVLWNCAHPANAGVTMERVSSMRGADLHAFKWLADDLIGELPYTYNFISGVSPRLPLEKNGRPDVIHFTDGGPWFPECPDVPYGDLWLDEYHDWQLSHGGNIISSIPTASGERRQKPPVEEYKLAVSLDVVDLEAIRMDGEE